MKAIRWQSLFIGALAFTVSVTFVTPIGAQGTSSSAGASGARALADSNQALAEQRAATAESILAAKEQARGEAFGASIRAGLKSRMEELSMDQLAGLAQLGADADIPSVLGSVTSDLVYTPVTPCRVFDSRTSQGGPGPIAANGQRNVFVAGTLNFPGQGGLAGGCGVPVGATSAIINFVTVTPSGPGDIRAWAVTPGGMQLAAPLAAVLNYGTVAGLAAIANGVAVPLCNPAAGSCSSDLRLQADISGTDILGDVVGYFSATLVPTIASSGSILTGQIAVFYVANSGGFTLTAGTFRLLTPVGTPGPTFEYTTSTTANCPGIGQSNIVGRVCIYGVGVNGVTSIGGGGGNTTATIRHGFSVDVFFNAAANGWLLGSWAYRVQ